MTALSTPGPPVRPSQDDGRPGGRFVGREAVLAVLAGHLDRVAVRMPAGHVHRGSGRRREDGAHRRVPVPDVHVLRAGGEHAEELVRFSLVDQEIEP